MHNNGLILELRKGSGLGFIPLFFFVLLWITTNNCWVALYKYTVLDEGRVRYGVLLMEWERKDNGKTWITLLNSFLGFCLR